MMSDYQQGCINSQARASAVAAATGDRGIETFSRPAYIEVSGLSILSLMTIPAPRHTASTQARACRLAPCVTLARESDRGSRPAGPFSAPRPIIMYTVFATLLARGISFARRVFDFSFCKRTGGDRDPPRPRRIPTAARRFLWAPDRLPLGTKIGTLSGPATLRRAAPRAESVSSRFRQVYRRERVLLAVAIRRLNREST